MKDLAHNRQSGLESLCLRSNSPLRRSSTGTEGRRNYPPGRPVFSWPPHSEPPASPGDLGFFAQCCLCYDFPEEHRGITVTVYYSNEIQNLAHSLNKRLY